MKNFTQLFKRSDFDLVNKVISRKNYNAFQVISTDSVHRIYANALIDGKEKSVEYKIQTLMQNYALKIWNSALEKTLQLYPGYYAHEWIEVDRHPIKRLILKCTDRENAENYFYEQLCDICYKEEVKASEEFLIEKDTISVVVNLPILDSATVNKIIKQFNGGKQLYEFKTKDYCCAFNEIAGYFIYFDTHLLHLLNIDECAGQISELDAKFLDAASWGNLNKALNLLKEGANVNALDKFGDSAITLVVQNSNDEYNPFHCMEEKPSLHWEQIPDLVKVNQKTMEFIGELLKYGADINIFGEGGFSPLYMTTFSGNHVLMEFLLKHGADPNLILDPTYNYNWSYSEVLSEVYALPYCSDFDEKLIEVMENLLIEAGARR